MQRLSSAALYHNLYISKLANEPCPCVKARYFLTKGR
jgi:hypothetical protein